MAKLLLNEGVYAAMVDSRSSQLKAHRMMETRGVKAVALLEGHGTECGPTGDERQSLLVPPTTRVLPMNDVKVKDMEKNCIFPNVPFKRKSGKRKR